MLTSKELLNKRITAIDDARELLTTLAGNLQRAEALLQRTKQAQEYTADAITWTTDEVMAACHDLAILAWMDHNEIEYLDFKEQEKEVEIQQ